MKEKVAFLCLGSLKYSSHFYFKDPLAWRQGAIPDIPLKVHLFL